MKWFRAKGFTLVELVMVILLLSIGATVIVAGYGQVARSLSVNEDLQAATQLAQECGEYVVAARRDNPLIGYSGVTGANFCSGVPNPTGLSLTIAFTDPYRGVACPGTCKLAAISVTKGGDSLAMTNVMLARY